MVLETRSIRPATTRDISGKTCCHQQKTEVIIEHFRQKVISHLGGRAKAMVVTSSRLHAVRYMQAFERYLDENKITDIRRWWLLAEPSKIPIPDQTTPSRG